jgi:hypothetical protein
LNVSSLGIHSALGHRKWCFETSVTPSDMFTSVLLTCLVLPVTVESADVILTAKLRISIHAGIAVKLPSTPPVEVFNTTIGFPELKGGIEVRLHP